MRKVLFLLALALILVSLSGAAILHAPLHQKHKLASSNVCVQFYNWPIRVGNGNVWVEPGTTTLDTSTGTKVLIMPVKMIDVDNRNYDIHPEKQFTFMAHNGVNYPRAFGVPAVTLLSGHSTCFTLGFKFVPGGTGSAKCPFDGAGLNYYNDLNHQQLAANWQLIWAPC